MMKRVTNVLHFSIAFLILAFLLPLPLFAQKKDKPQTPEQLGEAVFQSFKNNDSIAFAQLIFTDTDCETMCKTSSIPDSSQAEVVKQMKTVARMTRRSAQKNFLSIQEKSREKSMDWSKAKLMKVGQANIRNRDNIPSMDLLIFCQENNLIFAIVLGQCHKSDAWLMMVPKVNGYFISEEKMKEIEKEFK